jgi:glycosyltransferase involved in cell wall biosynthesis
MDGAVKSISDFDDHLLKFVCLARDVPHKNLASLFELTKAVAKVTGKTIELYSPKDFPESEFVISKNISGINDTKRDELLKKSHFNLLLSLDHSQRGFYEGFGLTVLEAGKYATPSIVSPYGGLPEAVHNKKTGWVVSPDVNSFVSFFKKLDKETYERAAGEVYRHTLESHDESLYGALLDGILRK